MKGMRTPPLLRRGTYRVMETRKAVSQSGHARQPLVISIIIACLRRTLLVPCQRVCPNRAGKHQAQATNSRPSPCLRLCLVVRAARVERDASVGFSSCLRIFTGPSSVSTLHEVAKPRPLRAKNSTTRLEQSFRRKGDVHTATVRPPQRAPPELVHISDTQNGCGFPKAWSDTTTAAQGRCRALCCR